MKRNIIAILIISLILLTGCESKTDKLENKINELESTINDMSTSTTTTEATTTTAETTTTSSSTKKKVAKATTTTSSSTTTSKKTISTTTAISKGEAHYPVSWNTKNEYGLREAGQKICTSENNGPWVCKCYLFKDDQMTPVLTKERECPE